MRRAYTLLELIVVMGILFVLVAVLAPVLTGAKAKAKETVCASNMRQLGLALELYRGNADEYPFPGAKGIDIYLNEAAFKCDASARPDMINFASYINLGFAAADPRFSGTVRRHDLLLECREKRAGEYPLLVDVNHLPKLVRADDSLPGFALAYRIAGNISRIPRKRAAEITTAFAFMDERIALPCSASLLYSNL